MPGPIISNTDPHPQSRRFAELSSNAAPNTGLLDSNILGPIAARLRKTNSGSHWQPDASKANDNGARTGAFFDEEAGGAKTRERSVMSTGAAYIAGISRRAQANAVLLFVLACLVLTFRSLKSHHQRQGSDLLIAPEDHCKGKRIFMYDLPPEFNVVVRKESKCSHSLMHWMDLCPRFTNGGYGENLMDKLRDKTMATGVWDETRDEPPEFDLSQWHDSDFYMLEMIFHTRLQSYQCLTLDPTGADAFFVPYYTGLLALDYLYDREDLSSTVDSRRRFGSELILWLETNGGESWTRYGAVDHFLVMGRTSWDFKVQEQWGAGFSAQPHVANMTALTLERDGNSRNEHAIPYPTAFHPKSRAKREQWLQTVRDANRTHLFAYVGGARPESWSARGIMSSACESAGPDVCHKVDCALVKCSHDPVAVHSSFLRSKFCLQPRGDSATRKSTFDCLISGSIPVFFHVDSAYTQYTWHLPPRPETYSVFIDEEELRRGQKSILAVLQGYSDEQVAAMREQIIGLIGNLVYVDYADDAWAPKSEKDAFEVTVDRVLEKIAAAKEGLRGGQGK